VQDQCFTDSKDGAVKGPSHEDSQNMKSQNNLVHSFQRDV
jgi:hypothetical protein